MTTRKSWGEIARAHHVPLRWLRLIAEGNLEDPAFVHALKTADLKTELWALVSPAAQEALFLPTLKIETLGGSRDQLLSALLERMEAIKDPRNRNFAQHTTALTLVNDWLDHLLQARMETNADRGRRGLEGTQKANAAKTAKAAERASRLHAGVEARRSGTPKTTGYAQVGRKEGLKPNSVKKAIARNQKRQSNGSM